MPRTGADGSYLWHVAVNNPTDTDVTAVFRQGMDVPGLEFSEREVTVPAGGYLKLMD